MTLDSRVRGNDGNPQAGLRAKQPRHVVAGLTNVAEAATAKHPRTYLTCGRVKKEKNADLQLMSDYKF
jgi:hypothetical protein